MERYETALIQTLCYSDIFDYPLSKKELWHFLIDPSKLEKRLFEKALERATFVKNNHGLYFLTSREEIVSLRLERKKESKQKLKLAQRIARLLFYIPTVSLIGISGALAVENTWADDDIDLFVITQKNTVWLTRFLALVLLQVIGKRRKKGESEVSNKICLNMLLDEQNVCLPKSRQNLYSAHEVVQMKLLFERNETYKKFLIANQWVKRFLPNAFNRRTTRNSTRDQEGFFSVFLRIVLRLPAGKTGFSALEYLARTVQLWYMRKNITNETIENNFAAFHPFDYKEFVMREYKKRLKEYRLEYGGSKLQNTTTIQDDLQFAQLF